MQLAIVSVKIELGECEYNKLPTHEQYEVVAKCISQQHHGYSTSNTSTSTTFTAAAGNTTTNNSNKKDDSPDTLFKLSSVKKYGTATSTNNGKSSSLQLVGSCGGAANYNGDGSAKDKSPIDFLDTHQLQSSFFGKKHSSSNRPSAVGLEDENTKNGSKSPSKPAAAGAAAPLSPRKTSPPQFSIPKPTSKHKLSSSLLDFDSVGLRNTPKEKSNDDLIGVASNSSSKKRVVHHTKQGGRNKKSRDEKFTSTSSMVSSSTKSSTSRFMPLTLHSKDRRLYQISPSEIPSLSQLPKEWERKDPSIRSQLGNKKQWGCSDWQAYPGANEDEKRRNRALDDSEVNGPRNTGVWKNGPFSQVCGTKHFECCKDKGGCGKNILISKRGDTKRNLNQHKEFCPAMMESLPSSMGLPLAPNGVRLCWCMKDLPTLKDEGIVTITGNNGSGQFPHHESKCRRSVEYAIPMLAFYMDVFPEHKSVNPSAVNTEKDWTKKDSRFLYNKLKRNITKTNVIADVKCFGFNDGGATLPILLSGEGNEVAEETLQAVIDSAGEDDGVVDAAAVEAAKKKGFSKPFIEYEVKEAGLSMPAPICE